MEANTVTTGKVRFSYCHLAAPSSNGTGEPKYSVSLLIDKSDKKTIAAVKGAIEAAKEIGKDKKWGGKVPMKLDYPLHDGDDERPDDPVYAGTFYLNAKNTRAPKVVDRNKQEIIDIEEEVYSGCYGRASVTFFPYDFNGKKGVGVSLGPVQKLADGEPLGGSGVSVDTAFGDLDDEEDVEI